MHNDLSRMEAKLARGHNTKLRFLVRCAKCFTLNIRYICGSKQIDLVGMADWSTFFSAFTTVAFHVINVAVVAGVMLIILLGNRNPVKTLAWLLVLFFLPVVGLILYVFFGHTRRKDRMINKRSYHNLLQRPMAHYLSDEPLPLSSRGYERLIAFFQHTNHAFPFAGNRLSVYATGQAMLESLLEQIALAQHHIHLEFYIFESDRVGQQVKEALIAKAKQGVEVRVLYDDVGSWRVPSRFF